jgi:CTP synthase (UTP-ammonia lyase)
VLLCRSEQPLPDSERRKIALFTNVPERAVISAVDLDNIYKMPRRFHEEGLDAIVLDRLRINAGPADLSQWDEVVDASEHPVDTVTIAVVGKYIDHQDAYKSLAEALKHGGLRQRTKVKLKWLESSEIEQHGTEVLKDVDGILVPGGFGDRGFEGKVLSSKFARESGVPYFGICYGMQAAGGRRGPPPGRPGRRQQHRERQGQPASGDRPDHRMAHRQWRGRASQRRQRPGRHHAPGPAGPAHQARARWRARCTART